MFFLSCSLWLLLFHASKYSLIFNTHTHTHTLPSFPYSPLSTTIFSVFLCSKHSGRVVYFSYLLFSISLLLVPQQRFYPSSLKTSLVKVTNDLLINTSEEHFCVSTVFDVVDHCLFSPLPCGYSHCVFYSVHRNSSCFGSVP